MLFSDSTPSLRLGLYATIASRLKNILFILSILFLFVHPVYPVYPVSLFCLFILFIPVFSYLKKNEDCWQNIDRLTLKWSPYMRRSICYCEPAQALAGEYNTWNFVYTSSTSLPKGTKFKFDF